LDKLGTNCGRYLWEPKLLQVPSSTFSSEWRRKIDDFLLNLAAGFYTVAAWVVVAF